MKTLQVLKIEFRKTIFNYGFMCSVFITAALLFTSVVYCDNLTGKSYSVIEAIFSLDRDIIHRDISLSSYNIMLTGVSGYFVMFIPIIAAFPFIPNFCAERNSGLIRFTIQRTGRYRYYFVKFLSAVLGGGLAILLGYLIYTGLVAVIFPSIKTYGLSTEDLSFYLGKQGKIQIILAYTGMFLYGIVSVVPAFLMASFVRNRYIITCVPFMITYLYSTGLTRLLYYGFEHQNQCLVNMANTLKPEQLATLYYQNAVVRNALIINLVVVALYFILFVCIMNKRRDLGE